MSKFAKLTGRLFGSKAETPEGPAPAETDETDASATAEDDDAVDGNSADSGAQEPAASAAASATVAAESNDETPAASGDDLTDAEIAAFNAGAAAQSARIFAILDSEEAKGRMALARSLAATDGIGVDAATGLLSKAAAETQDGALVKFMDGTKSDAVAADGEQPSTPSGKILAGMGATNQINKPTSQA